MKDKVITEHQEVGEELNKYEYFTDIERQDGLLRKIFLIYNLRETPNLKLMSSQRILTHN